jgi:hypothetical protein
MFETNPSEIPCAENSNLDISQCTRRNILKVDYQYYLKMAHQYNANKSIHSKSIYNPECICKIAYVVDFMNNFLLFIF